MSSYKLLEAVDLLHIATVISSDIHRESFVAKRISTVLLDKLRILDFFASANKSGLHGLSNEIKIFEVSVTFVIEGN